MRPMLLHAMVLVACGRIGFGEPESDPCAWDPVPMFDAVTPITSVNTAGYDADPTLSEDALTLFFFNGSPRMARRATRGDPFGQREEIPTSVSFGAASGFFL